MDEMFSIKEILQSEKFQKDAPEKLKNLITISSPKAAMSPTVKPNRRARRSNQTAKKAESKNVA